MIALFSMTSVAQTISLSNEAWNESEWICVADAPEVQGRVDEHTRAADGANWFVTSITNEKKVKTAWMNESAILLCMRNAERDDACEGEK